MGFAMSFSGVWVTKPILQPWVWWVGGGYSGLVMGFWLWGDLADNWNACSHYSYLDLFYYLVTYLNTKPISLYSMGFCTHETHKNPYPYSRKPIPSHGYGFAWDPKGYSWQSLDLNNEFLMITKQNEKHTNVIYLHNRGNDLLFIGKSANNLLFKQRTNSLIYFKFVTSQPMYKYCMQRFQFNLKHQFELNLALANSIWMKLRAWICFGPGLQWMRTIII